MKRSGAPAWVVAWSVMSSSGSVAGCGGIALRGASLDEAHQTCIENALRRAPDEALIRVARPRFEASCREGEAASCSALGLMHELGLGVAPSPERAVALYERACTADNPRACVNLGRALERGHGAPRDASRATQLFGAACDRGEMSGCAVLGRELATSPNAKKADRHRGRQLLSQACDAKETTACVDLGDVLSMAEEPHEALVAYTRACLGGDAIACRRMDAPIARTSNDAAAAWHSR